MKREIKFRGKRVDDGKWIVGSLVKLNDGNYCIYEFGKTDMYAPIVDPKTVGQYTGLTDEDGVDIYEGDIVTYFDFRGVHTTKSSIHDGVIPGWIGTIEWDSKRGWVLNKNNDHNKAMLAKRDGEKYDRNNCYIYENESIKRVRPKVIGNVYETSKN